MHKTIVVLRKNISHEILCGMRAETIQTCIINYKIYSDSERYKQLVQLMF